MEGTVGPGRLSLTNKEIMLCFLVVLNLSTVFLICFSLRSGASFPSLWVWAEFIDSLPTNGIRIWWCGPAEGRWRKALLTLLSGVSHCGKASCHVARACKQHSREDTEVKDRQHLSEPSWKLMLQPQATFRWLQFWLIPGRQPHERPWARTTQISHS